MIKAKFDLPTLEKSLKRAARNFGETNAQAVIRWGVQTCRELAKETQVWGKVAKETKGKQEGAMWADARNVLVVVETVGPKNKRGLRSPEDVNDWIEVNRTRRRGRTAKLPIEEKRFVTEAILKKAMRQRAKLAGIAKGGWLGAGMMIASHQKGQGRINIGKNYLGYAQKHSRRGHARPARAGWAPIAELVNKAAHTGSKHVLGDKQKSSAIMWGAKATIKWYNRAAKQALDKK